MRKKGSLSTGHQAPIKLWEKVKVLAAVRGLSANDVINRLLIHAVNNDFVPDVRFTPDVVGSDETEETVTQAAVVGEIAGPAAKPARTRRPSGRTLLSKP